MNSVSDALNTLVSAVNVAYQKGGVYSLEEAYYIYSAISYLNNVNKKEEAPAGVVENIAPEVNNVVEEQITEEPQEPQGKGPRLLVRVGREALSRGRSDRGRERARQCEGLGGRSDLMSYEGKRLSDRRQAGHRVSCPQGQGSP